MIENLVVAHKAELAAILDGPTRRQALTTYETYLAGAAKRAKEFGYPLPKSDANDPGWQEAVKEALRTGEHVQYDFKLYDPNNAASVQMEMAFGVVLDNLKTLFV